MRTTATASAVARTRTTAPTMSSPPRLSRSGAGPGAAPPRPGGLPQDPTGIPERHEVLAAEEFAMPAARRSAAGGAARLASARGSRWGSRRTGALGGC